MMTYKSNDIEFRSLIQKYDSDRFPEIHSFQLGLIIEITLS